MDKKDLVEAFSALEKWRLANPDRGVTIKNEPCMYTPGWSVYLWRHIQQYPTPDPQVSVHESRVPGRTLAGTIKEAIRRANARGDI